MIKTAMVNGDFNRTRVYTRTYIVHEYLKLLTVAWLYEILNCDEYMEVKYNILQLIKRLLKQRTMDKLNTPLIYQAVNTTMYIYKYTHLIDYSSVIYIRDRDRSGNFCRSHIDYKKRNNFNIFFLYFPVFLAYIYSFNNV